MLSDCPVLYPTVLEFASPSNYLIAAEAKYSNLYGMVKIVPPATWRPNSSESHPQDLPIKNPIEQNVQGIGGYYECRNIVQPKMSYKAYQQYAETQILGIKEKTTLEREELFWKTITYSPPLYGADLTGSLMDSEAGKWNMKCLDTLLRHTIANKVKGVTEPYCYIGSWKSLFCWHKEDLDLSAINYLHQGASKVWYSIRPADHYILQKEAAAHFPASASKCKQFLRHKTTLINPYLLKKKFPALQISRMEHKQNEFMVVFQGAYHCGFNCGLNVAEAVNFATPLWLSLLVNVSSCSCSKSSVKASKKGVLDTLRSSSIGQVANTWSEFAALEAHVKEIMQEESEEQEQEKEGKEEKKEPQKETLITKPGETLNDSDLKQLIIKKLKKGIRKPNKKGKRKIVLQEIQAQVSIQHEAQCDECSLWRVVEPVNIRKLKEKPFRCAMVRRECNVAMKDEEGAIDLEM